jgi:5S rRNA maturation endonuclease (ribonuclease M5)
MKLPIEPLSQNDVRWKLKKLGTSTSTIGGYGCNLVCHSMMLRYYKHEFIPDALNQLYIEKGVYQDQNLINFWAIPNVFPDITADQFIQCPTDPAPLTLIDEYLNKNKPVILLVDFDMKTQGLQSHFVLAIGKDNNDYLVNDPWTGETYWFTSKYGDPALNIYGLRLYSGPVVVQEEHYLVNYKGQTLATYEKNPIDIIDQLTKQVESLKETNAQEIQNNATLQSALTMQEKDNAQLSTDKRSAQLERDNTLAELKEAEGFAHDLLKMDDLSASEFREVSEALQGLKDTILKLQQTQAKYTVVTKLTKKLFIGRLK